MIRADQEVQSVLVNDGLAQLRTALGREGLPHSVIVIEQILPDRLALEQGVEVDLLLRLRCGFRLRLGYRFWLGLRRRRRGDWLRFQLLELCGMELCLLLELHETDLELSDLLLERRDMERRLTILCHRRLNLCRKSLRLRAQP